MPELLKSLLHLLLGRWYFVKIIFLLDFKLCHSVIVELLELGCLLLLLCSMVIFKFKFLFVELAKPINDILELLVPLVDQVNPVIELADLASHFFLLFNPGLLL